MTTKVFQAQLNNLTQEMIMLRSVVIGVIGERDAEGQYRPEFVEHMLKLAKKSQAGAKFSTPEALFKMIA